MVHNLTINKEFTGAFSAEAQSALLAVTPNILNGSDLDTELAAAEEQFNQTIQ